MSIFCGTREVQYLMMEQGLPDSGLWVYVFLKHFLYMFTEILHKSSLVKSAKIGNRRQLGQLRQGAETWAMIL